MKYEEDFFKRQFPTSENTSGKKDHPATQILNETVVVWALGIDGYIRLLCRRPFSTVAWTLGLFFITQFIVENALHLRILHYSDPETFTARRLHWFYRFNYPDHFFFVFGCLWVGIFLTLGFRSRFIRTKYQKMFENMGLVTRTGETPVLVIKRKLPYKRVELEFDGKGVSKQDFDEKIKRIEANFKKDVESIEMGKNPSRIRVILTKQKLERITYRAISALLPLPPDSFYLGMSNEGPLTVRISDLPHMLIAGTTGSGKSVFFKQVLMGLLKSSLYLQMYLIDLKGGLEMIDFKHAPNVKVVKTMKDAVELLRELKQEMESRFKYLEEKNFKSIVPERDGKERIVIGVDEASVLYMKRHRQDPEYELALEARTLTDHLAKLSRAAGIHVILATQKLTAEVIPTTVTENISGRMCFRAETLPGSLLVLGNGDAFSLPKIPGQGIWRCGNKHVIVQAPSVTEEEVQEFSKSIAGEFEGEKRKRLTEMVGVQQEKDNARGRETITKAKEALPENPKEV